jgi:hypothetical protein
VDHRSAEQVEGDTMSNNLFMRAIYSVNPGMLLLLAISFGLWATLLLTPQPIRYVGGDSISPNILRPGQEFAVTRNFNVSRDVHVRITRVIITGDCSKQCDVLDISSGWSYLTKGEYRNRARHHVIPNRTSPGKYLFHTSIQWSDRIGYWHNMEAPPLALEIVK